MVYESSKEFYAHLAARTLQLLGRPGIVLGSYTGVDASALPASLKDDSGRVLWVKWAPHERLMPRCAVNVHHGGCGTTAAALRAGRPSVVTPVNHDQPYWANQVEKLGVGVKTGNVKHLQAEALADAVNTCLESESMQEKAACLGNRLQQEEGVDSTVRWLFSYFETQVKTGRWKHGGS
mmetsp:Transcript_60244/g.140321  ORF Transcript_60244/g.140321 Transcript_60244/m.140321 type:complete len:179 (-) Transcript_60244:48-584(-)